MCATGGQEQLGQQESAAYTQAQQLTQQQYGSQQAIYGPMVAKFQSIFNAGPNQEGFSPEEKQNLNSQALEGTAENYAGAAKAIGESEAAEGGGTNPLPSGAQEQLKANVATSAAENESNQETQIVGQDYAQGRENFGNAASGLESIASGENPLGYESAATSAGGLANSEENAIAQEDTGWESAVLGAAGSIGSAYAKGGFGGGGGGGGG
jgi:hypothetical protein